MTPSILTVENLFILIKKVVFFSSTAVQWIVENLERLGLELHNWQISALLIVIDLIIIYLSIKYIGKPLLKIIIVILLLWIALGFFIPIK